MHRVSIIRYPYLYTITNNITTITIDLSICFSTCYFLYLLYFGKPRLSSNTRLSNTKEMNLIISRNILNTMYITPLVLSPVLHLSLKVHILKYINMTHIASFCTSLLCPMLYVNTCMEQHIVHYVTEDKLREQLPVFGTVRLILSTLIFICVQGYSIFDDLKVFSSLHEPLASATVCATAVLIIFCIYLQMSSTYSLGQQNEGRSCQNYGITNSFFTTILAITCSLIGVLLNMSMVAIVVLIIWAISMAELYQRSWLSRNTAESLIWCILVLTASSSGAFVAFQFTLKTIYHLNFQFIWQLNLSMQQLCYIFSVLIAVAVIVPTLAFSKRQTYDIIITLLPHAFEENTIESNKANIINMFSLCFQGCAYLFTALELTIREQNWQSQGIMTSQVYPPYLLCSTTLLFYCTALHLHYIERVGFTTVWIVFILQGCKLLNLVGMSLLGTTAISSMILSHTLPFFFHFENVKLELSQTSYSDPAGQSHLRQKSKVSTFQILSYIVSATGASYWFFKSIMHTILSTIMRRETSIIQDLGASLSLYFLFVAALLMIYRRYLIVSSFVLMLAVMSLLVAADALGPIKLSQTSSSFLIEFQFFPSGNDDNGIYMIVSFLLVAMKILNVIPIRKLPTSILFASVFSYTLSKGIIGFFPYSQSIFRHDVKVLWIHCIVSTFLGTLIVINSKMVTSSVRWMFIIMEFLPFITLGYSFYIGKGYEYDSCIIWIAVGLNTLLSVTTRIIDILIEIRKQVNSEKEIFSTVSMLSAISGMFWTAILSLSNHNISSDIALPLSFMLFACIKPGLLFDNISPITACTLSSSLWWFLSGLYCIFIKGLFHVHGKSMNTTTDISIWTSSSLWYPVINFFLLLMPIPSIVLEYLQRSRDTEDLHFVLSIVSSLPIIGSQNLVIRLLGIVGLACSAKRCYDIGKRNKKSRRII